MFGDGQWSNLRSALIGAVVAAVVLLTFPAAAAVGSNLILGQSNSADAITSLSGAATTNLRITNTQAGAPALDLRVVSGSAPLKVNSTTRIPNLNADRLDGKHGGAYLLATGTAANSSLLDGLDSTAFARRGLQCPPGETLVGYGRSGPMCSSSVGSVTVDSAGMVGYSTSLVLDASGFPVIAYSDFTNEDLKLAHCGNAICTSGNTIRTVDSVGQVGDYPSLVLDASGFPVIAYSDTTNGDLKLVHCGDATCSSGNTIVAVDTAGSVGDSPSLVLDASGFPVISYLDWVNDDLKLAHCGNATCSTGNVIRSVDTTPRIRQGNTSLALDTDGNPVIAYYDFDNGDVKLVHCGDTTCGAGNTIRSVDTAGDVGLNLSMVLDTAGNPVIAYYDLLNEDLKLAHCGDSTCSTGNVIRTVDGQGGASGINTSLVLDTSGNPVISYGDLTFRDLKVAHCWDPTCADASKVFVDTGGSVGEDTSLVLDASGHPIISYLDVTNADLKLAMVVG